MELKWGQIIIDFFDDVQGDFCQINDLVKPFHQFGKFLFLVLLSLHTSLLLSEPDQPHTTDFLGIEFSMSAELLHSPLRQAKPFGYGICAHYECRYFSPTANDP